MKRMNRSLFDRAVLLRAAVEALKKLNPRTLLRNPVIFVTELGALLSTLQIFFLHRNGESAGFVIQISLWLWFTVLFANLAEAVAEGRGKAQAKTPRNART